MNLFKTEELNKINAADDLKISPFRADKKTYGTPTWIWYKKKLMPLTKPNMAEVRIWAQ